MLFITAAHAHVGDVVGGVDVSVVREDTVTEIVDVHVEASFGLLFPKEGSYRWVCHEAVTAPKVVIPPRYTRSASGRWLAWMSDPAIGRDGQTLFSSADGCDWPAVGSLAGATVVHAAFDPADGLAGWAVTATPEAANAIWSTSDGGVTFTTAIPPMGDRRFLSVVDAGGEVWATARDEAGGRLFLWHHSGAEWVEHEIVGVPSVVPQTDLRVLAAGPPGEVWLVVDPFGDDLILRAASDGTWAVAFSGGWLNDAAWDGERLWMVRNASTLTSIEADGTTMDHPAFPSGTNIGVDGTELWTAPASHLVRSMVARSVDGGASFTVEAYPDDVAGPLACPDDSDVDEVCAPLWSTLLPRIRGFDDPPDEETGDTGEIVIPPHPEPGEPGCGCDAGSGVGVGWWLAWVFARRRST